jgi:two-component system cell cycle sensor histidine kinase/response regulator CckA
MSEILRTAEAIAAGFGTFEAAEAALVVGPDGKIMTWPREAEGLTGFSAAEATGRELALLLGAHPDVNRDLARLLESARRVGRAGFTRPVVCKRRGCFWGDIRVIALRDKRKETIGYLLLLRDLRARKEFVPQLQRLRAMEESVQDAAGVAHDLNNLTTILLSHTSALAEMEAPAQAHAQAIASIAERMAAILKHFVLVITNQRRRPVLMNVNDVVARIVRTLGFVKGDGAETIVNLSPALNGVRADVLEIEEVVLNLVLNARHATKDSDFIVLESTNVHVTRPITQRGQTLGTGDYIRMTVRDSGCGMSEDGLAHLFEPFPSTRSADGGTDLGLSAAFRIVNRLGGAILLRSKEGWGTLAEVYLPAATSAPRSPEASAN